MKKIGKRFLCYAVTVLISLLYLLILTQLLVTFSVLKFDFTTADLGRVVQETAFHPLQTAQQLIAVRNPLFLMGSVIILVYGIYVQIRFYRGKKEGWEVDEKNQYHGSARWARPKEIFDGQNFVAKSQADILNEFSESLKQ